MIFIIIINYTQWKHSKACPLLKSDKSSKIQRQWRHWRWCHPLR